MSAFSRITPCSPAPTRRWVRAGAIALVTVLSLTSSVAATERVVSLSVQELALDSLRAIQLDQGHSMPIRTDFPVTRVAVGDPAVADVMVMTAYELQVVPASVGTTNVLLWGAGKAPMAVLDLTVGRAFGSMERRIAELVGSEDLTIEDVGGAVAISGSVPDALAAENAVQLVESALATRPEQASLELVNMLRVKGQQQVLLHVTIAEVSRVLNRQFGTNFNGLFNTQGGPVRITSLLGGLTQTSQAGTSIAPSEIATLVGSLTGFGALESLEVVMSALKEKGLGRVLAEPTLVARSGEEASFLVGGEIPIPIAQGGAANGAITVEYRRFGVGLSFTPTVLSGGRIHVEVAPEVSEPDLSLGTSVQGTAVPGFNTRRATTGVELGDGESFAIAGLFRDDLRQISASYPGLGDIPVFGALFRSSRYEGKETELVIIVTPSLVAPLERGARPFRLPTDSVHPPSAAAFYLLGSLEGRGDAESAPIADPGAAFLAPARHVQIVASRCSEFEADSSESDACEPWATTLTELEAPRPRDEASVFGTGGFIGPLGFELPVSAATARGEEGS